MVKIRRVIISFIIIMCFFSGIVLADTGTITAGSTRVRKEKNTSSDILGSIFLP